MKRELVDYARDTHELSLTAACEMLGISRSVYRYRPQPLALPPMANQTWSMAFMSDALMCGRRFRTFNAVDDFNRESLAIEVDLNQPAPRVIRVLNRIASQRGYPERVRMDNAPEFVSVTLAGWAEDHNVQLEFIQPGRPMQNSYIERFNRTYNVNRHFRMTGCNRRRLINDPLILSRQVAMLKPYK